ncbi:MAG TPA: tagaturonate epimerase family protein [Sedimentisphaerales bacterium]|nr:tagaturonate epimerase family protein [Sedimentisphaerales bacterium]
MILGKYSFGLGDRFGHQGKAQLEAVMRARREGIEITPVWNKSNREHTIIGTGPADVRREADDAVAACRWERAYFVDADHIGLGNVDAFIESSDFFTLDVADFIGKGSAEADVEAFVQKYAKYVGSFAVAGIEETFEISAELVRAAAEKYLSAVKEAGRIYRHIETAKGKDNFITEVSMDETDQPPAAGGPVEMLFILAAIADEGIPAQTIAPKFSGRFNKGVDYVGSVSEFAREFEQDLAIVAFAVEEFGLPAGLKLSVHSGSDKFSIYGPINKALKKFDAGVHVKTAGTTWLEELIGLAMAGGDGLDIARRVYAKALVRMVELCGPYATVIDIDATKLPSVREVESWDGQRFAAALRHDQACEDYNPDFRQLLHVGYKVAAEMGRTYTNALRRHEDIIGQNVRENIYERHIKPIFGH